MSANASGQLYTCPYICLITIKVISDMQIKINKKQSHVHEWGMKVYKITNITGTSSVLTNKVIVTQIQKTMRQVNIDMISIIWEQAHCTMGCSSLQNYLVQYFQLLHSICHLFWVHHHLQLAMGWYFFLHEANALTLKHKTYFGLLLVEIPNFLWPVQTWHTKQLTISHNRLVLLGARLINLPLIKLNCKCSLN